MRGKQERQLTSTWLNIVGAGIVSGGAISQLTAVAAGAPAANSIMAALACIAIGLGFHVAALRCVTRGESHGQRRIDDPT